MTDVLPTMLVKRDGPRGYRRINVADFDPAKHTQYVPPLPEMPPPPPPPLPPVPPVVDPLTALPPNWQLEAKTADLKKIAAAVSGRTVDDRAQAIDVISEAMAGRA